MKKFQCLNCGAGFDTPSKVNEEVKTCRTLLIRTVNGCPGCESTLIRPMERAQKFNGLTAQKLLALLTFLGIILGMAFVVGKAICEIQVWRWWP